MYVKLENSEKALLKRIAASDSQAFRIIFDSYRNRIYSYSLHLTRSGELAEEIVQDVFMKLWINRQSVSEIDNIEAYLSRVTRNHTFNILKRLSHENRITTQLHKDLSEICFQTEEVIDFNDSQRILNQAIEKLPAQQKMVYSLCHGEGLKYEEAAQRLNISRLTVKTHMQHALRSIRAHFALHDQITLLIMIWLAN